MMSLDVEVYVDRHADGARAGLLRARVVQWQGEDPVFGGDLLAGRRLVELTAARWHVERVLGPAKRIAHWYVAPECERTPSVAERAITTPRDSYEFRSAGR